MARPVRSVENLRIHLLYGEGPSDAAFLTFLKMIFTPRGAGFQIKTDGDDGGDPANVLHRCIHYRRRADFASRTVLVDTDRPWCPAEVVARARREDVRMLPSRPCLEGLLLEILGQPVPTMSIECKRVFHRDHLPEARMMSARSYETLFPQELLVTKAERIPTLAAIIHLLKTGNPPETILPDV